MTIYITDNLGILTGPVEFPAIPGAGVQMPSNAVRLAELLPAPAPGHVWALINGEPHQLADHRGPVYSTATGEAGHYAGLGELPEGLTRAPRASAFHRWQGGSWVLDTEAQAQAERASAVAAVAAERYSREIAGIVWRGHGIATDRESQQKLSDERNAVKDELRIDGKGWKCIDMASGVVVFRPTSNAEILELSATAYRYVSDCFDREDKLLQAIATGTYTEAMLKEGWP